MKAYMEQTVLCEGKAYFGVGGQLCHYPKFEPEQYVILKLTPAPPRGKLVSVESGDPGRTAPKNWRKLRRSFPS